MPRKSQRAKLVLEAEQKESLQQIVNSRKLPLREVQRANILLKYAEGMSIKNIQKIVQVSRATVYKWIDKALAMGIEEGLKDKYHRPLGAWVTTPDVAV